MYNIMYLVQTVVVNRIINELTVAQSIYITCLTKNSEVLGCNGLLKTQFYIDLSYGHFAVLMDQLHYLLAKLVIDSPQDQRSLLKLNHIYPQLCGGRYCGF